MTDPETNPSLILNSEEEVDLTELQHLSVWAGLEALGRLQRPSIEALGYLENTTEAMSRYGLALIIEVGEFLNETPWKSWKKNPPDSQRMAEEFVDVLCFIGSWVELLRLIGIPPIHISNTYRRKLIENNLRFGVTKSPD